VTESIDYKLNFGPALHTEKRELLGVEGLVKHFPTRSGRPVRAVDGVSFTVRRGETLSLVGESGCGKTTTGQLILGLQAPTSGHVRYDGSIINTYDRPLRRRMQVVFQNPYSSLDPRMHIGDILQEPLRIHGILRREQNRRVDELLEIVHLGRRFADRYPSELSGGQRQRVAIARALALNPEFIVLDEPVSALDVSVQAQIVNLLRRLQSEFRLTYLFISHDLRVVRHMSDTVAVMYLGRIVEIGSADRVLVAPEHPYTQALISAVPQTDPSERGRRIVLTGEIPSSTNIPPGCRFSGRCPFAMDICRRVEPSLVTSGDGRASACHLVHPAGTIDGAHS
jgi:oligopeptide/dipeptide ABC transporter ATP-binding protein